jgi:hypothetical protein
MKNHPASRLAALAFVAATGAHAQLINENFNSNAANPNTLGWYYAAPATSTFTAASGALQFTSGDSSTNNVSVFRQFTETTLAVNETLQASFTFTAFANQPISSLTANNHFRIGLFDTSNTFTGNQGASPWTGSNAGYQMGIGAGSASSNSQFGYRTNQANIVSFSSIGTAQSHRITSYADPVSVIFSVTRTETGITLSGSYTQNSVTTTFTSVTPVTSLFTFDTLWIGYGSTNSVADRGFTIDNVSLTVIPEPSAFAALAGLGALGLAATRRRRGRG